MENDELETGRFHICPSSTSFRHASSSLHHFTSIINPKAQVWNVSRWKISAVRTIFYEFYNKNILNKRIKALINISSSSLYLSVYSSRSLPLLCPSSPLFLQHVPSLLSSPLFSFCFLLVNFFLLFSLFVYSLFPLRSFISLSLFSSFILFSLLWNSKLVYSCS